MGQVVKAKGSQSSSSESGDKQKAGGGAEGKLRRVGQQPI